MLRDWNFWCTVMTSVAAFVAIYLSVRQMQLSNKQQLFDRRLKAYMLANGIISLCKKITYGFQKKEWQNLNWLMTLFLCVLQTTHIWNHRLKQFNNH